MGPPLQHLAIEVKAATRHSRDQLVGLRAIADLPRLVRRVLVYLGERSLRTEDGIDVWPLPRFLREVAGYSLRPG